MGETEGDTTGTAEYWANSQKNGMESYDEFPLLYMNQGRSCQDECYLVEV